MKTEGIKMIGIIGAMTVEIEGIRSLMSEKKEKTISGIKYVSGVLKGKDVVTAVCGIGKVFAAICAQTMILEFDPELIINTGVGGALTDKLSIGDIAVAENVVQHDMDTSAIGDPRGLISGINVIYIEADKKSSDALALSARALGINTVYGTVASGDQFIASSEKKKEIAENFNAIVCEMEGAAIGHVCYVNKKPFAVLRAVSDGADENVKVDYAEFAKHAAENYIKTVCGYLVGTK